VSVDLLTGLGLQGHARKYILPAGKARASWDDRRKWYVAECECGWSSGLCHTQGHAANAHGAHVKEELDKLLEKDKM
jgi:hypothetical protein